MNREKIVVDEHRHLGPKALLFSILQHIAPALGILVFSLLLIALAPYIGTLAPRLGNGETVDRAQIIIGAFRSLGVAGFGIFIVVFVVGFIIAWLKYVNYSYIIHETAVEIEQGIFYKDAVSIPYRSIQNVDIKRSFVFRLFGLSTVVILTAGHEDLNMVEGESEGIIPIMDKFQAEDLRSVLLGRTHVQEVRHTETGLDY